MVERQVVDPTRPEPWEILEAERRREAKITALARKWCPRVKHGPSWRPQAQCQCARITAAVREALEEAYQRASVAADLAHALDAIAALKGERDAS